MGVGRDRNESFGLSAGDLRVLRGLKTPARIQRFIDGLEYKYEDSAWSPQRVLRERKGHCLEGALLAAAALRVNGRPPLAYGPGGGARRRSCGGGLPRRRTVGRDCEVELCGPRFRAPVYRTLRELALSYFEHYYNLRGNGLCGRIRGGEPEAAGWEALDDLRGGRLVRAGVAD